MLRKQSIFFIIFGIALGYVLFFILDAIPTREVKNIDNHDSHRDQMIHTHQTYDTDALQVIPTLQVLLESDAMSGYNIRIITENYTWAPDEVNTNPVNGEGHAHVYINGEKIARVYSEWFHIDEHHLVEGDNTVRVTLNANNHDEWAINGIPIESIQTINYSHQ